MEEILQKILKEGSSEKYAHICVKAHKALGKFGNNLFILDNISVGCNELLKRLFNQIILPLKILILHKQSKKLCKC
jgi:hypothetical protein